MTPKLIIYQTIRGLQESIKPALNAYHDVFIMGLVPLLSLQLIFQLGQFSELSTIQHMSALGYCVLYFLQLSIFSLILFLVIQLFSPGKARTFITWFYFLASVLHFLLLSYARTTGILLGADLYGYDLLEIFNIAASSSSIDYLGIFALVASIGLYVYFVYNIDRWTRTSERYIGLVIPVFIIGSWFFTQPGSAQFKTESNFHRVHNASSYFIENSLYYFTHRIKPTVKIEDQYPFLHDFDRENPLGEWLNTTEELPGIVIIAVEGLGADFVGKKAKYGGAMPFLDSLTSAGLYWSNCLSNTGRTFGALPTLTGSLPYAENGFMDKGPDLPDHLTLWSWLKSHGYQTSYFHGGDASFDKQDVFLEWQQVDYLLDEKKFPNTYQKMKGNTEGFTWGYGDLDLFKLSLEKLDEFPDQPVFSFFMTLTTHEPFNSPGKSYTQFAEDLALKKSQEKDGHADEFRDNIDVFACLKYADEALEYFLTTYSRRRDFQRTIFVITGDHRLIPVATGTRFDRFKVPLLIYSPMVKKPISFEQIVSHAQLVPSIFSWLHASYGLDAPVENSFIGRPFATDTAFGSSLDLALMRSKNEMKEYICGEYLLSDMELYKIQPDMSLSVARNDSMKSALSRKLSRFENMSTIAMNENRLMPPSKYVTNGGNFQKLSEAARQYIAELGLLNASPDSLYFAARALAFDQKYKECRMVARYALRNSPNYHDVRVLIGRTYAWSSQYDSAVLHFDEVLRRNSNHLDVYCAYSDVAYWNDRPETSLYMAAKGLQIHPESLELMARTARGYLENGDIVSAKAYIRKVLNVDPNHSMALQLKGQLTNP